MPDRNDDLSATDLVASAVSERLQLSGERDRLKTLLMDDLRSHGWTETMYKCATKAAVAHQVETEHETMGTADDGRRPLSAQQLAQLIAKQGHGSLHRFSFCIIAIPVDFGFVSFFLLSNNPYVIFINKQITFLTLCVLVCFKR